MKILHLISSCGLFGAETIALNLAKDIQDNGNTSIVGAVENTNDNTIEIIERAKEAGIETYILKCTGRFDLSTVFRLKKYIRENKIDVLHTHNYKSDTIGVLAARLAKVPVVSTAHGFTDVTATVSIYEKFDRWLLRNFFNRVAVVTDKMLNGFPAEKKRLIPNGIDIDQFEHNESKRMEFRDRFGIQKDEVLIGTVGRLSKEKNQQLLIDAAEPLMRANKNIKLLIVGSGPEEAALKKAVEWHGIKDRVIFTGIMRDLVSVYSSLDIFVLCSLTEGIPLTILEAMASRLAVIATRVGGIPEIIESDKTGLLVESQDKGALTVAIKDLLDNKEKQIQVTSAAYEFVRSNYSLRNMCESYEQMYADVLMN